MDDFTTYGDGLDEALANLENTLLRWKESNVSLSNEKCFMMETNGIILGHRILEKGLYVYKKIKVILNFPTPNS